MANVKPAALTPTFTYRPPKQTKKQQVLAKHKYEEKVYYDGNGSMTRFLAPIYDTIWDKIANINEGEEGPEHFAGSIVFKPNETVKELFLRLGWISEDGKIL